MKKNSLTSLWLVWGFSFVVWSLYRYFFQGIPLWIEEFFFKPLVYVMPVVILLHREKSLNLASLGLRTHKPKAIIGWGMGFGLLLVSENFLLWALKDHHVDTSLFSNPSFLREPLIALATGFSEEILYRGFIMERLWQRWGNVWKANIVATILFMLAHVAQAVFIFHYGPSALARYLILIGILSISDGYIYQHTRSVYATVISHSLWNFSNVLIK